MPIDPRLDLMAGAETNPEARLAQRVTDLERRLAALEAGGRRTYAAAGAPTITAPDGALYVDTATNRFYARTAGVWRYTALT